jgi:hypothetical protein
MSVPPDRMAGPVRDPNKILGLPKWAFWVIMVLGVILAYYIYKHSTSSSGATLDNSAAGTTEGVTAADIGGTPADNSFATQTDQTALEEQIQSLQNSIAELEASNGGNGAGVTTTGPGGSPGPTGTTTGPVSGDLIGGGIPNSGQFVGGIAVPSVPTEGLSASLMTGGGIGNSPTAMQNLFASGFVPASGFHTSAPGRYAV